MNTIKTGHEKPVDRVAARLLMRAPWWAQYPEPAKFAVQKVQAQHSWEAWIDYCKAPPRRPGTKESEIKDHRGTILHWAGGMKGTVIGYADAIKRVINSGRKESAPPWWRGGNWNENRGVHQIVRHTHCWWVEREGEIVRVPWKQSRNWLTAQEVAAGKLFPSGVARLKKMRLQQAAGSPASVAVMT